jgi:simple sugar transport system ATP-binding protein
MAVLCGTHDHYEGEICINNQPVSIREPLDAKQLGIHLVQQEVDVALIPGLSIAENIMLDSWRSRGIASAGARFASRRAGAGAAGRGAGRSPLHRQLHAGRKTADFAGARAVAPLPFLILDEPTAPLDQHESERLFAVVRRCSSRASAWCLSRTVFTS